jgi:hypothetical protein
VCRPHCPGHAGSWSMPWPTKLPLYSETIRMSGAYCLIQKCSRPSRALLHLNAPERGRFVKDQKAYFPAPT